MEILTFAGGPFVQNTLLLVCADGATGVLFDPGAATPAALGEAKSRKLRVAAILLTHAHVDHIDGVALARRETGADIHLHPLDRPLYDVADAHAAAFGVPFEQPPPPDADLVPGRDLAFGGSRLGVIFVPGHSPGHVMFVCGCAPAAISGDLVFRGSIGRTNLPGGDHDTLMDSIRREVLTLPPETRLYPGHGPETTVGRERLTNPFLAEARGRARAASP